MNGQILESQEPDESARQRETPCYYITFKQRVETKGQRKDGGECRRPIPVTTFHNITPN